MGAERGTKCPWRTMAQGPSADTGLLMATYSPVWPLVLKFLISS